MTRREVGFLLVGLGFGLMLALAAILEVLLSLYRTGFVGSYSWKKTFVVVPVLLLGAGVALIAHRPRAR
jgi:hypothetical protein